MKTGKDIDSIFSLLKKTLQYSFLETIKDRPAFQILISTILSQRTRDEQTAAASKNLFSRFKTPRQIADADLKDVEKLIKKSGFYRNKAKTIKKVSKIIVDKYNCVVPKTEQELLSLPGVGHKTAACVLVYAFGIPSIAVDTHVHRITNRIGLVKTKIPEETQKELMKNIPKRHWLTLNSTLVSFGQTVCKPVNPRCSECPIAKYCDYFENPRKLRFQHELCSCAPMYKSCGFWTHANLWVCAESFCF